MEIRNRIQVDAATYLNCEEACFQSAQENLKALHFSQTIQSYLLFDKMKNCAHIKQNKRITACLGTTILIRLVQRSRLYDSFGLIENFHALAGF